MLLRVFSEHSPTSPQSIMLLKHTRYSYETYVIPVTNKDSPYQCLGERIFQILYRRCLVNHDITPLYYLNTLKHKHKNIAQEYIASFLELNFAQEYSPRIYCTRIYPCSPKILEHVLDTTQFSCSCNP